MRKICYLLLAAMLVVLAAPSVRALDVSAKSAIVMDVSGVSVFEKDADTPRPMASTTKIMTALVALEEGELSRVITVSPDAVGIEGSGIGLRAGDTLTLEDLLLALLLESANDAAAAIAIGVSGSIDAFVSRMNARAASLGLTSTHFANPHGLPADAHVTTARELALLAAEAMKNEGFASMVSKKSAEITVSGTVRYLRNHNRLLSMADGVIGVKTGFTKVSGRCLVSAASRGGVTLIAVTLDAPDDWNDHMAMLDLGFSKLEACTLIEAGTFCLTLPSIGTIEKEIRVTNADSLTLTLRSGDAERVQVLTILPRAVWCKWDEGAPLGKLVYRLDGQTIGESRLICAQTTTRLLPEPTTLERIFKGKIKND